MKFLIIEQYRSIIKIQIKKGSNILNPLISDLMVIYYFSELIGSSFTNETGS